MSSAEEDTPPSASFDEFEQPQRLSEIFREWEQTQSSGDLKEDDEERSSDEEAKLLEMCKGCDKTAVERLQALEGEGAALREEVARAGAACAEQEAAAAALERRIALLVRNRIVREEEDDDDENAAGTAATQLTQAQEARFARLLGALQARPACVARLLQCVRGAALDRLARVAALALFGAAGGAHAEHALLVVVRAALADDFAHARTAQELLRGNTPAARTLAACARRPHVAQYLADTLSEVLTPLCADPTLDLDIDAAHIYDKLKDETAASASSEPEVLARIEAHAPKLVAAVEEVVEALARSLPHVPYGLRLACREIRRCARTHFPEAQTTALVGGFFMLRLVTPAVAAPDAAGLVDKPLAPAARRNMLAVARVLQNLANDVAFGGVKEPHLAFLNPLLRPSYAALTRFLNNLSRVPDLEQHFDDETSSNDNPVVSIALNDLYFLHGLLVTHRSAIFDDTSEEDDKDILAALDAFPAVPTSVPHSQDRTVNITLVPGSSNLELAPLFRVFRMQVLCVLHQMPHTSEPGDVLALVHAACEAVDDPARAARLCAAARVLLAHGALCTDDNCRALRRALAADVRDLDSCVHRAEADITRLRARLAQLRDAAAAAAQKVDVYTQYLANVRVRAATPTPPSARRHGEPSPPSPSPSPSPEPSSPSPSSRGFRVTHTQLIKDGVVLRSTLPEKVAARTTYDVTLVPGRTGAFQFVPRHTRKKRTPSTAPTVVVVDLEELLERQAQGATECVCGPLVFHVGPLIHLVNKRLLAS